MPQPSRWSFEAIGTHWTIETVYPLGDEEQADIRRCIEVFDATHSRFRDDSLVASMSKQAGVYVFPEESQKLFQLYDVLNRVSEGKVNPLAGVLLEDLGYDAQYSLKERAHKRSVPVWSSVERIGPSLRIQSPVVLDVGAAGKGALVDEVVNILSKTHDSFVVDAGGDMRHKGVLPNKVGLEDPRDTSCVIGAIEVKDASLCASAVNRRAWGEGLHHVVDPDTRTSTQGIIATWVISEDGAMVADGLATALFFCEPNVLREHFAFEYLRMNEQGAVDYSPLFEGQLF